MKLIFISLLIVLSAISVLGCQPVFQSHTKYFRKAKAVFAGTVVSINLNDSQDSEARKYNPYKIKFLVEKSWKGNKSEITVVSDNGSGPCDQLQFRVGEKYLVYAFGKSLTVTTYVGNRNRPLEKVNYNTTKELAELNNFWFRLKANFWWF